MASHNSGLDNLNNLDKTFSNVVQTASSAYSAAHSSGSGGGGGFSGGGGGRRRWRKLRWKIKLRGINLDSSFCMLNIGINLKELT